MLVVRGFAFDAHVAEEIKRYGKLAVLPAKMNPHLAMSHELLKKTGTGNLFMVFGEPDVEIRHAQSYSQISQMTADKNTHLRQSVSSADDLVIEIKGMDVYDPTTGQIRNSSTDDIACWFIDTDYNGESFFVRHAYFPGAEKPYEKLKNALRAEIDEAAWSALYSTISRPFPRPAYGVHVTCRAQCPAYCVYVTCRGQYPAYCVHVTCRAECPAYSTASVRSIVYDCSPRRMVMRGSVNSHWQ